MAPDPDDKDRSDPTGTLPPSSIDIGSLLKARRPRSASTDRQRLHSDAVLAPYVAALPKGPEYVRCRSKCNTSSTRNRRKPPCFARCWMDYGGRSDPEQYDWEYEEGEPTHYRWRALEGRYWMTARGTPEYVAERMRLAQTLSLDELEDIHDQEADERANLEEKREEAALKLMEAARQEKAKLQKIEQDAAGPSVQKPQWSQAKPNTVQYTITLRNPFARPIPSDPTANTSELYSVADTVEFWPAALHKHIVRLYAPAFSAIGRSPSVWASDGRAWKTIEQVKEATLRGDQFSLFNSWLDRSGRAAYRLWEHLRPSS